MKRYNATGMYVCKGKEAVLSLSTACIQACQYKKVPSIQTAQAWEYGPCFFCCDACAGFDS